MLTNKRNLFIYGALISLLPIIMAYFAEHVWLMHPCRLCHYQRILYFANVVICAVACFAKVPITKWLYGASLLTAAANLAIAVIHSGLERNWWVLNLPCALDIRNFNNAEAYQQALKNADLVSCSSAHMTPLGISMADLSICFTSLYCWVFFYGYRFIRDSWLNLGLSPTRF